MATATLCVPEECLLEVVNVIRTGVEICDGDGLLSKETWTNLNKWCDETEKYMKQKPKSKTSD